MDLVATCGLKTDLHIHSYLSAHKDGKKVNGNTLDNLSVLVKKFEENEVNICAITDHDAFDYNLYRALKNEEKNVNSIMKVFPGVEFSVLFDGDIESKVIHIITIFDDADDEKVKNIENVLKMDNGKPKYNADNAFSEDEYISILKNIGIDTVMIAHQKNSLSSKGKSKQNDASTLGEQKFNEFLFFEYFEAYEFRNKKNELFNKKYIFENNFDSSLRMITGSDCHKWEVYPKEDESSTNEYVFTYIKCLPCFKGLVMAITDYRRIKLTNSFFNPTEAKLDSIKLKIDGIEHTIPLSKGINVIIGDNSVGKSLLLYKINYNRKLASTSIKRGYDKYLKENKIDILTKLDEIDLFRYDTQGEVRKLFEEGKLKASEFLHPYFPSDIDLKPFRLIVDEELEGFYEAIQNKFEFDRLEKQLSSFKINCEDSPSQSITFIETLKSISDKEYQVVLSDINEIISKMEHLEKQKKLEPNDVEIIKKMRTRLMGMRDKYDEQCKNLLANNKRINVVKTCIKAYKKKYEKQVTDEQKVLSSYYEDVSDTVNSIVDVISARSAVKDYKFNLSPCKIIPNKSEVYQYVFISKLNVEEISNKYIENVINGVIKKNQKISTKEITQDSLKKMILYYPEDATTPLETLKEKISSQLDKDFLVKHSIIQNNMDVYKELSDGLNAQIYFTLISGESRNKGIYIIDQPEDHVSPKAIKDYLLDQFKDMGESRQVIMVTHNPQFIVNLDVDNVIFLSKEDKHSLKVLSGALEYEDNDYSVLKIIAENVEGGLETVSRRMKRYEKGLQFEN